MKLAIQLHLVCSYTSNTTGLHGVVLNQAVTTLPQPFIANFYTAGTFILA
jgi:hypothetical protein